jgi:hypothetical protein
MSIEFNIINDGAVRFVQFILTERDSKHSINQIILFCALKMNLPPNIHHQQSFMIIEMLITVIVS